MAAVCISPQPARVNDIDGSVLKAYFRFLPVVTESMTGVKPVFYGRFGPELNIPLSSGSPIETELFMSNVRAYLFSIF